MMKTLGRKAIYSGLLTLLTIAMVGVLLSAEMFGLRGADTQKTLVHEEYAPSLLDGIEPAGGFPVLGLPDSFSSFDDFEYLHTEHVKANQIQALYLGDFASGALAKAHWSAQLKAVGELNDFDIFIGVLQSDSPEAVMPLLAVPKHKALPLALMDFVAQSACRKLRNNYAACEVESIAWPEEYLAQHDDSFAHAGTNLSYPSEKPMMVSDEAFKRLIALKSPSQRNELARDLDLVLNSDGASGALRQSSFSTGQDLSWASYDQQQKSTVQAAVDAAYNVVSARYLDTIRGIGDGVNQGDSTVVKGVAMGLATEAIESAASEAFETFLSERFGNKSYNQDDMRGLQSIFIGRFKSAAAESIKTAGKQLTREMFKHGGFKLAKFDSAIIKQIETDLAKGLIDASQAAAKNSKYAALRNLEIEFEMGSNSKPKYSALTVQPIYDSADQRRAVFAQASFAHEGKRTTYNAGLSYRFMPLNYKYLFGVNSFIDYQDPYDHWRASIGADIKTSLYGAAVNYYKTLSDWRDRGDGFEERSLDGYDLELSGRVPNLPALEFFAKAYTWKKITEGDDISGQELSAEYTPVPAMTLRAFANDENDRKPDYGVGVRYNHKFGAPRDYAFNGDEQYRLKNVAERRFEKVRRSNEIRVEERLNVDDVALAAVNTIGTAQFNAASTNLPYSVGGAPFNADIDLPFDTAIIVPNGDFGIVTFSNGAIANISASGAGNVVFEFNATTLTVTATNGGFVQFISAGGGINTVNVPGGSVNLLGTDIDVTDDGTTTTIQVRAGSVEVVADVGGGTQTYNQSEVATLTIGTGALGSLLGGALTSHQEEVFTNLDALNPVLPDEETAAPFVFKVPELTTGPQFAGNNTDILLTFSKAVLVTGAPQLNALIDVTPRNFIYQPTESTFTKLVFRHVYLAGDVGATTLTINNVDLNGGSIQSSDTSLDALLAYTQTVVMINDETLPTLLSSTPADEGAFFDRAGDIVLNFSEDIVAGTGNIVITDLSDGTDNRIIPIADAQVTILNNVLTLNPSTDLEVGTNFEITIGGTVLDDANGNGFVGLSSGDLNFDTNDATPPVLLSFSRNTPAVADTNADSLVFRVLFDEAVLNVDITDFVTNGTTATPQSIAVVDGLTYDVTISGGDLAGLAGSVGLDLAGAQDITDEIGNALAAGEPTTDQTYTIDNSAPALNLAGSLPLNSATQVARSQSPDITLNFTDASGGLALGTGNITITDTDDASDVRVIAATDPQVSISGLNVEIDLTTALEYAENYEITFDGSFVEDAAGNAASALTAGNLAYKTVDLEAAMTLNHSITIPADNIDENNVQGSGFAFPVAGDFVLAYDLDIPANPTGLLFECGGAGQGQFVGINTASNVLRARGGEGGSLPPDTDMATLDIPLALVPAGIQTLLVEFDFAGPSIRMWLDETLLGTGTPSGGALESNRWSGGDNCAVATTTTTSVPTGETTTVFNGPLLNPVRLYSGQTVP
jgi:hypothetical protein